MEINMIPIRIFATVRLEVAESKTRSGHPYPFHKKNTQPEQVLVNLRIGQASASYCKKIFTRAAFPFFAAWCRTGSRSPFKSFFLRSLGAKIQRTFKHFQAADLVSIDFPLSLSPASALHPL